MKSSDEAANRPRTQTGNLRVIKLLMEISGDKAWSRPSLALDRDGDSERVCVVDANNEPGVAVAFFKEDDVHVILLPDETLGAAPQYAPIGEVQSERWPERALYALKLQRDLDGAL